MMTSATEPQPSTRSSSYQIQRGFDAGVMLMPLMPLGFR
jgi:hypothetical protein